MSFSQTTKPAGPDPTGHARTLAGIFTETVARSGLRIAIDAADRQLSYRDLDDATGQLAQRLAGLGVGAGDRVGVRLASGTAQLYTAILGVIRSGAAYVPVDADDPPARAEAVWSAAGVCAVIEDQLAITELAPGTGANRTLTVDDDAWIIFTSGSTGRPKGWRTLTARRPRSSMPRRTCGLCTPRTAC